MDEALAVVEQALGDCLSVPLWSRSAEDVVSCLDRVQGLEQRLAALKLALVREVDARGVALLQGAPSMVAWLRDRHRVSPGAAKRSVQLARSLDPDLTQVAAALIVGEVNNTFGLCRAPHDRSLTTHRLKHATRHNPLLGIMRLPPPTHPPHRLASQHRQQAPRLYPTRIHRQGPQTAPRQLPPEDMTVGDETSSPTPAR